MPAPARRRITRTTTRITVRLPKDPGCIEPRDTSRSGRPLRAAARLTSGRPTKSQRDLYGPPRAREFTRGGRVHARRALPVASHGFGSAGTRERTREFSVMRPCDREYLST